ncbi:MAG: glycoside hydrolase family 43 protein, partial [Planctomycetales bacterium]|nr:glycoside hydrolase family 43 protein [Planctomycetales bacterium]
MHRPVCSALFLLVPGLLGIGSQGARGMEIANPLVEQRADPWVYRHTDGYYYYSATVPEYDRLELRRAERLADLGHAEAKVVWRKHDHGAMGSHIWAPEIHHIDGKWYLYFAAGGAEDVWAIRMYVLENAASNPLEGEWVEKGQIRTDWESFSLDATTFEHRGTRFLAWAQHDPKIGGNTCIYLAKMDTPWSIVSPQVRISRPEYDWETVRFQVNEGAAALVRNGYVFLSYSSSATDRNYAMGLLAARDSADLLDPASWWKSPTPVMVSSPPNSQFGPGHNSFTVSDDGKTDLLVYHARNYRDIEGDPLHNPDRHTRVQPIAWRKDGFPYFGAPAPDGPVPSAPQP